MKFGDRAAVREAGKPCQFPQITKGHIERVDMKEIILTQGKVAIVDDEDFEHLNAYKWHTVKARKTFYAVTCLPRIYGEKIKRPRLYMHREVIGAPKGMEPDHIDGNGLNNLRNNLRIVTHRQNLQNIVNGKKTSQYPGVSWEKNSQKWLAIIRINGPQKNLGLFTLESMAFDAYRKANEAIGQEVLR